MSDKTNLSHNVVNKEEFAGDPKPHLAAYTLVREDKGLGSTPKLPLETSYVKGLLKHDKFFQKALSNPIVAREFFEEYLPTEIKALFSPTTLTLENDSFIDPNLKESITDVLYSARINNRDCYIYIFCANIKVARTLTWHFVCLNIC
ncbi:RPE1 domain protein [Rickettsia bellii str. RML Mogi]|uniref:RPE1 domain protein n=1 Tax=Rickettsia bellii str. RML Mogi TaxID=1359194 RepID=A0A0F3QKI2_RICBE|nr:RPE1 domain protein [Rickettsia bellii str. RML Mogi]